MAVIREPEGVDFTVSGEKPDRQTILETAEWLAVYRREHDQSRALQEALRVLRREGAGAPARVVPHDLDPRREP